MSPVNQIKNCGGCHAEPESLIDGYLTSVHGKGLLLSGLIDAPSCSDCHGGHAILVADGDKAATSHFNSPEVCGTCHLLLFAEWKSQSAHGLAWQAGEQGPVCTDCHSSHSINDPTMPPARLASAGSCGNCHSEYLSTFRDSFHRGNLCRLPHAAQEPCGRRSALERSSRQPAGDLQQLPQRRYGLCFKLRSA
jgi:hypothetical protein